MQVYSFLKHILCTKQAHSCRHTWTNTHLVHLILNSTVDRFDMKSINALIFGPVVWWRNCCLFDIEYHTILLLNNRYISQPVPKNKCINWVYIDGRIWDRMDKLSMNRPLVNWMIHLILILADNNIPVSNVWTDY